MNAETDSSHLAAPRNGKDFRARRASSDAAPRGFRELDADSPSLYSCTGNIAHINTLLVNRNELRQVYPWWVKLQIRVRNWRKLGRFALHFDKAA